jgi:DNA-binding IclR family transcriptional regulator
MIPAGAMPARRAAVLAAVRHEYTAEGRVTVRAVARRLGVSTQTVCRHLRVLRDVGLVGWDDGTAGTLRPTFEVHECG